MTALGLAAVSYNMTGAALATGISETRIKEAVASNDLVVHYNGSRPVILATDLAEWVASLPTERAS